MVNQQQVTWFKFHGTEDMTFINCFYLLILLQNNLLNFKQLKQVFLYLQLLKCSNKIVTDARDFC